ncbi:endonuclease/exonuclease/phosphatase family protein [Geodermatophilus sp. YIM 151500]|uniref:endonuclease/exonuclease/phosphatase family protein n=1 Tax=Geodermatophilus sp. YIM 151500 TaxID=2984531 RepID=UPI0021E3768E|nr:endonuclease/exonuclease/phosphatase family protein [Geodermatophilus sp. YIM 151500]MCV2490836.1 endonuclease/exonuclease/phosphatase family protein [Geodermatophilus sp. YIM 151500]
MLPAVVVAVLATVVPSCGGEADGAGSPQITVMTRNLYVGARLDDTIGVSSLPELVAATSREWSTVLANDFPTRAGALADEIARARPDVVGLQEVTLWRDQSPSDLRTHPGPNATRVVLDLLAVLQRELSERGTPYTAVATSTNEDTETARRGAGGDLVDLRVTDRDVILVRADQVEKASNPRHDHYAAQRVLPSWPGPIRPTRGWTSIDYRPDARTTVRIVNTHLEIGGPDAGPVQEEQGDEVLALIAASPHPVIALGDFNSAADGSTTDTYDNLTRVLHDAWTSARPSDAGPTCCQAELLDDPAGRAEVRIDLVLTSEDWPAAGVERTGTEPFRAAPAPLWASDHFGVTARITIPR